ncbi:ligase-associated DNA damage response endonuclease PdeM [Rhodovulum strictum]|uniref:Ligase-associated DNA damage response endonuclease PdeM n=1 Tax=Rhodovulum strictum TaxID=58314 RepID=A0A844B6W5_9RHOB|nr:ligase-associated DNA damage response endonuclease PdeM [Rhodovulum strictum]MRH20124.1 ligase-associated DNA damage response endonuclease PdeM [Rhodovulum strictum]
MTAHPLTLSGALLSALPSGALYWAEAGLLAVADLHLGKAERLARRGGTLLPPYDSAETLTRLEAEIARTAPQVVVCLGDSFDDDAAARALPPGAEDRLLRLMAGRRWVWIAGNHDPGPATLPGTHLAEMRQGPLTFRHIARPGETAEISGHYHPKARLSLGGRRVSRPCFLADAARVILPAFGAYTGGLASDAPVLDALMGPGAVAILTGPRALAVPMRPGRAR